MRVKYVAMAIAAAFILLILAVWIVLATYDYNKLKPTVTRAVSEATGRELAIDGDIRFEFSLTPRISATGLRFQNAAWASRKDLAMVRRIEMQVALLPLLRGTLRVQRLVIIEPDVMLEMSPSGATNFGIESRGGGRSIMPKLAFEDVLVLHGKFTYFDSGTGKAYSIGVDRMLLQIPGVEEPIRINLDATYHRKACNVKGTMVPLATLIRPDKKHRVDLTARSGEALVHVTGGIADVLDFKKYNLRVSAAGPSMPDILQWFELGGVPRLGPFRVSAALSDKNKKKRLSLDTLELQVGSEAIAKVAVRGAIHDLISFKKVDLQFSIQGADAANLTKIGLLLPLATHAFSASGRITDPEANTYAARELQIVVGKETIDGTMELHLGADRPRLTADISSREFYHGPFRLSAVLTGPVKKLSIDKLDFRMGTQETAELTLKGRVNNVSNRGGVELEFGLRGKDLENLEKLLGWSPPVRGPFTASGKLRLPRPRYIEIANLQTTLGENHFVGSGDLDLTGERPRVAIQLDSSSVNLESVLKGPVKWLPGLNTLPDLGPLQLYLESLGSAGEMAVERLNVRAGSEKLAFVQVDGSIQVLRKLTGVDLGFTVRGNDVAQLERLTGQALPIKGPFALSGHVVDSGSHVYQAEDLAIEIGKTRFSGWAKLDLIAGQPRVETRLSSERFSLQALSLAALPSLSRVSDLGPLTLEAALAVAKQGLALEMLNLTVGKEELVNLRLKGSVDDLASLQGVALEFEMKGKDVARLERLTSLPLPLGGNYALWGTAKSAQVGQYMVSDLNILLGENHLKGSLEIDLAAKSPLLVTELSSQRFNLQPLSFPKIRRGTGIAGIEDLGPLELTVKLSGPAEELALRQLKLSAGKEALAAVRLQGTVENIPKRQGIDLHFDIRGKDLKNLAKVIGYPVGQAGSFAAQGWLSVPASDVYAFKDLKVTWADTDVCGEAQIDLTGRRPVVSAALSSRKLDIRPFLGDHRRPPAASGPVPFGTKRDKVFSSDPLPFDRLGQIDADVKLQVQQLLLPRLASENTLLNLKLKSGHLDVSQMRFQIGPGQAEGRVTVRSQGNKADLDLEMTMKDLDMGATFDALKHERIVEGSVDANVKLSSSGGSVAELMAALNGRADLVMGSGRASMKYLALLDIDVGRKLFQLINPLKKDSQYTEINCLVERLDIEKGLTRHKLFLDTEQTTLVSAGQVDLKTEGLDISIKSSPQKGLGIAGVAQLSIGLNELTRPFKLGGTLSKPTLAIDTTQTTLTIGKALGGFALFGPFGILTALGDVSIGSKNSCVKAIQAAQREAEQSGSERQNPDEETKRK
jgi:phage tail tube protein FII